MTDTVTRTAPEMTSNLPTLLTRIVGRADMIELILREVSDSRLVSIVGPGGIGKTTVALAVAERALRAFADGVWLVDFAPLKEPSLVPNAIATATGLVVHSADIMSALCRFLRERRTLFVLDNCEHMAEALAPCVAQILAEAPNVHVLLTSRAPLRVAGERVHRLPGLSAPPASDVLTAKEALTFPAIELFVERATDRLESFTLSDAESPAAADICRNLDGIALAIELAAMRVDAFGVLGLRKQLDDRFRRLGVRRTGLERHRTLAATLDWSYSLLPAHEAAVLRAVSVFAGTFRLKDAVALAEFQPEEAKTVLAELAAQSLLSVEAEGEGDDVVYRPLETTRAYCLEKLVESDEDAVVRLRHAQYVEQVIHTASGELSRLPAREWAARYRYYVDDLRAALAWAAADGARWPLLIRLTTAGTVFWNQFSLTDESCGHLARAIAHLEAAGEAGTAVEMNLQLALSGATLFARGMMPEAKVAVERARAIAVQRGDTGVLLQCLRIIGTFQLFSGENEAGIQTLQTFVSLAAAEDASALPEGETHLGCGDMFIGRLGAARARLERLYADGLRDMNDASSLRFLYHNNINVMIVLSHAQWLTGAPGAAVRTARMVVEYARKARHDLTSTIGLAWATLVFLWAGCDAECQEQSTVLEDLTEKHGIVTWHPVATFCLGALASRKPETLPEGVRVLERAITEFRAIGHIARLPFYMSVLAEALVRSGRLSEAESTTLEALELTRRNDDNWSLPEVERTHAVVLAAQGRAAEQEQTLLQAMGSAERLGAASWRLRAAIDLARLQHAQSRSAEAKGMLKAVFDTLADGAETGDVTIAAQLLGELS